MKEKALNPIERKEIKDELEVMYSIHKMSKDELCVEVMLYRDKAIALKKELDLLSFLVRDAKTDVGYL
jgi:hypothetical protein